MKKRSTARKIIYSFIGLVALVVLGVWIFYTYYFQDAVTDFLGPRLQYAVSAATHGRYRLTIGKIVYKNGAVYCTDFELRRIRYNDWETGITVESVKQDTVFLRGLHIISLLRGKGAFIARMEMTSPRVVVIDVEDGREKLRHYPPATDSIPEKLPEKLPVIAFDSIILTDMNIEVPEKFRLSGIDSIYHGVAARLAGFRLDEVTLISEPLLYSKHLDLDMPKIHYDLGDSVYFMEAGPIHTSLSDSLVEIDSFSIRPKYSETAFAEMHHYLRGRMEYSSADIHLTGFDIERLMEGKCLSLKKCTVGEWRLDYYSDKRKPRDPHPPPAVMPNELAREFQFPVDIDSLVLDSGKIRIRERAPGSKEAGVVTFDRARMIATPYCTDTSSADCGAPTLIRISARFLGEAPVTATVNYHLQHKELDMDIDASVGRFSAKRLNDFLIPNERKEITDGTIEGGTLKMDIHGNTARTSVTPRYQGLSMKILPNEPGATRGLWEGLKTFVANTFVLRSSNLDKDDIKATSATTTLARKPDEEFLQFIWFALRKSLGKVIGGF
ncbi:MAG: hypothetical protein Q8916_08290 [Bacteroidota bacterium]|nr:hypothetical protein [Bacteroidota bacterium]MDP4230384.1 hypothetical protein [Bacteroidota bacterium]MDP4237170.1 hypothetical protein [Bacteroidota bacterium]